MRTPRSGRPGRPEPARSDGARSAAAAPASRVRRVAAVGLTLLLVTAACAGGSHPGAASAAPDEAQEGPPAGVAVLVDDRATANPELRSVEVAVPAGLRFPAQRLSLPPGFSASVLATNLTGPRFMAFDEAGNLLVAAPRAGTVYRYPAADGAIAPSADPPALVDGLDAPSSVALHGGYLYVGETRSISRFAYDPGGAVGEREVVVAGLPSGGHNTRTVAFGPDGLLYVGVGSSCNICEETDERRAAVLRYNPDGSNYERFAWGLRNPVGLAFQPESGLLWATVNERDNQGNEIPPDLFTVVRQGQDFGWPRCLPPEGTPQSDGADCSGVTPPTVGIQAHSAPLGVAFYAGAQFPADYQGDAIIAQHGSWNRQPPAAPKLLRVDFEDGRPVSAVDFATGWQPGESGERWGRPAGVIVAPDGSLIVSDDQAGVLYRIQYAP